MYRKVKRLSACLFTLLLAVSLAAVPAFAQSQPAADTLKAQLESYLSTLKQDENSIGLHAGISVYDLTDKTFLYQHNEKRGYIPASNMKLLTTIAGFERLGPSYRWKTEVFTTGGIAAGGVVTGDLVLKGYGDPSLSEQDLAEIAAALKQKGITSITGNLLVDESYFDAQRLGPAWMWDDEPYGYSAQISGLAVHKNSVTLTIVPGASPQVSLQPATAYLKVNNQLQSVPESSERNISIVRPRGKNEIILTGTMGTKAAVYEEDVTVEDPALFVGEVWKQQLLAQGIAIGPQAKIEKTVVTSGTPVHTHLSKTLAELCVELNKESDNFYAEMLLKTLGATQLGEGSFSAGSKVVSEVLQQAGVPSGYRIVDGSGLSRLNWISTEQMVSLLAYAHERSYRDQLVATLPIAGVDGTLKNRLVGTAAANVVTAKTGSMGGVNGVSGYVTAKNGHTLAFSILINGIYKSAYARNLQDHLMIQLASYPEISPPQAYAAEQEKTYRLSALLDPVLDQAEAARLTAGVLVKSLDATGEEAVWYEKEADLLLTPAASIKLLTSAAALEALGPDFSYKTEIYGATALPANGIVNGSLYVKGHGDPTLHTEDAPHAQNGVSLESIAAWLKENGVKRISGDLVLDESYFDQERLGLGWTWEDENEAFSPRLGALSANKGTVMLVYRPGAEAGSPVQVQLYPQTSYLEVNNEAITVDDSQQKTIVIERERGTNRLRISGNLPVSHAGGAKGIPVEEPALYAGTLLKEKVAEAGIEISPNSRVVTGTVPAEAVKWTEFSSPPLSDIVWEMNKNGDNFYAEMILKTLGAVNKGEGSAASGAEVVQEVVQALGGQINFDMVDGSGLTRYNLMSPRHTVAVLEGISKEDTFDWFVDSLSVAGVDGRLKDRLIGTNAQGNLSGTIGSLTDVDTMSGIVTTKNGERLAFSILINGYAANGDLPSKLLEQVADILASYE